MHKIIRIQNGRNKLQRTPKKISVANVPPGENLTYALNGPNGEYVHGGVIPASRIAAHVANGYTRFIIGRPVFTQGKWKMIGNIRETKT